jgi:O-antigen/teichoic acid export membrane protein
LDSKRTQDPIAPVQEAVAATEPGNEALALNRESAARGFAWTAGFSFVAKVIYPLAGLYISRTLGPTILGIAAMLQMTMQLSEVIRDAGLTQTFLAEVEMDRKKETIYTGLALLTGLVPALLVLILTPAMASFFDESELKWALPFVAVCLVLNALGTVPNAMLLRRAELKRQGMVGLVSGGVTLAITILLVVLGLGFKALVAQLVIGSVLGLALTLKIEPLRGIAFDRLHIGNTFKRSRALLGANLINNVFLLCDIFVIQKVVGAHAAGLYNTAQNIAYKPADLILFPMSKTLMVAFSQSSGDPARLARAYYRSLAAIALIVLPLYVLIAFNADAIIGILLGKQFLGGVPVLQALCIYLAFRTFGNISGNALVPAGKHHWTLWPWFLAIGITMAGVAFCATYLKGRGGGEETMLMGIVWSFTGGAIAVYALIFALAVYAIRPQSDEYRRVIPAFGITLMTSLVVVILFSLGLPPTVRLLLCLVLAPIIQLGAAGKAFENKSSAYLDRNGLRTLWARL